MVTRMVAHEVTLIPSTSGRCLCGTPNRRPRVHVVCQAAALELPQKFSKARNPCKAEKEIVVGDLPVELTASLRDYVGAGNGIHLQVTPKGDLVLCKVAEAEQKTTGGIMLPTQAQKRPTSGDIVAIGDGNVAGKVQDFHLKVGETVLYSKFGIGVTDIVISNQEHCLIKEEDCIGVLPRSGATADDIPELKPNGDRVLLKIFESSDVTMGGVLLPDSAKEKPIAGKVVRVGPGKREKDGSRKAPQVKEGDEVLYFKWAGDSMETPDGQKFVVVHENDILCKV